MKEELQIFLHKRLNRDIDILKQKIELSNSKVRDQIDAEEYQRLVCSFTPLLITNSTNLAEEFQTLSGPSATQFSPSARIQHLRYAKLSSLSQEVSDLHNKVYL